MDYYSFDVQSHIYAVINKNKHEFVYDVLPIDKKDMPLNIAIYKLFIHDFIDTHFIPNQIYCYYLGIYYHMHKNYEKAIRYFSQIFNGHFNKHSKSLCDDVWYLLGTCYENIQEYDKMKECYVYGIQLPFASCNYYAIDGFKKLALYYNSIQKDNTRYMYYLLALLKKAQSAQNKKALQFLESQLFDTKNYDPASTFDIGLLMKIEKEMIRLEVVNATSASSTL